MNAPVDRFQSVSMPELLAGLELSRQYQPAVREVQGHGHLPELFGRLNPLTAIPIALISERELEWSYSHADTALAESPPFCSEQSVMMILCDDLKPGPVLDSVCERQGIGLARTAASAERVLDYLYSVTPRLLTIKCVQHGVFLAVMNTGVLITGASGVGKSEVALDLVQRGHQLVADDAVQIYRNEQGELVGECPRGLKGYIEIRGLGIVNIEKMFGPSAVLDAYRLQFIIDLKDADNSDIRNLDRLQPSLAPSEILDIPVPRLTMLVAPGRNLSVLVEAAVRDHLLRMSGVDSSFEFLTRHNELMLQDEERGGKRS